MSPVCSGWDLAKVVKGRKTGEPVTGSGSWKEGEPVLSDPVVELL